MESSLSAPHTGTWDPHLGNLAALAQEVGVWPNFLAAHAPCWLDQAGTSRLPGQGGRTIAPALPPHQTLAEGCHLADAGGGFFQSGQPQEGVRGQ